MALGAASTAALESGGLVELREQRVQAFEREYLTNLLRALEGDVAATAHEARLPRATLYRLLKKYDLSPAKFRL
ncbi:MAG: hypothetical protein IPI67_24045 [Myxococcales bacterium]|nr:hypothetical protein [Myxococcales bacterium]